MADGGGVQRVYAGDYWGQDRHPREGVSGAPVPVHCVRVAGLDVADDSLLDDGRHVE